MARSGTLTRRSYGSLTDATEMPNLLDVQVQSYRNFLQQDVFPDKRERKGLHQMFSDIFPVTDVKENFSLEYVSYHLGPTRYTIPECRERNMSYAAPLKVTMRLIARQGEGEETAGK